MYLLDTNIFIRGLSVGFKSETTFLQQIVSDKKIAISVVVVAEFLVKANSDEIGIFNKLLKEFGSLSIDEEMAKIAAEYRKQFLRKTKQGFLLDCFLAAQAKIHDFVLVTNDLADFPMKDISIMSPSADALPTKS
jgi:predicted nucleic acid-binding protein